MFTDITDPYIGQIWPPLNEPAYFDKRWIWNGYAWDLIVEVGTGSGGDGIIHKQQTALPDPSEYKVGDEWLHPETLALYKIYDNDGTNIWVEIGTGHNSEGEGDNTGEAIRDADEGTPTDPDSFTFWDSVNEVLKRITWVNLKAAIDTFLGINRSTGAENEFLNKRGNFVEISSGGDVEEAPTDGNLYGRRNAGWDAIIGINATIQQISLNITPIIEVTGDVTTVAGTTLNIGGTPTLNEYANMFIILQYSTGHSIHKIISNTTAGVLTLATAIVIEESNVDYDVIDPYEVTLGENDFHIRTTTPNVIQLSVGNNFQQVAIAVDGLEPVYIYDGAFNQVEGKEVFTYNNGWI